MILKPTPIRYDDIADDENKSEIQKIYSKYFQAIKYADKKARQFDAWKVNQSSYIINSFLSDYADKQIATIDFYLQNKEYIAITRASKEEKKSSLKEIITSFGDITKNDKVFDYGNNTLSELLMDIFIDLLYENNTSIIKLEEEKNKKNLEDNDNNNFTAITKIAPKYTARFQNFEEELLKFNDKKIDDNDSDDNDSDDNDSDDNDSDDNLKELENLSLGSSKVMYAIKGSNLYILTYSPVNKNYLHERIKENMIAPNFSLLIYKDVEYNNYFINNFSKISELHNSFIQFCYSSDLNNNITSIMGEASLVVKHWNTKGIEHIIKDHKEELENEKNESLLFAEYIVRYILAAEIDGVNAIEIYPFERAFIFNQPVITEKQSAEKEINLKVLEGLLESNISNDYIAQKSNYDNKYFAYEWERKLSDLALNNFILSKKKIESNDYKIEKLEPTENDKSSLTSYSKTEKIIEHLLENLLTKSTDDKTDDKILEYRKYIDDEVLYLYASNVDLSLLTGIKTFQEKYIKSKIKSDDLFLKNYKKKFQNYNDDNNEIYTSLFKDENLKNAKIVLFSYIPNKEKSDLEDSETEKSTDNDGFTVLLIANEDLQKSVLEQKSEEDDFATTLKLVIKQYYGIQKTILESNKVKQTEFKNILNGAIHTIGNLFSTEEEFKKLDKTTRQKVLNILQVELEQLEEAEGDNVEKKFDYGFEDPLKNSYELIQSLIRNKENLSIKFTEEKKSEEPWNFFATEILNLEITTLKDRIWTSTPWSKDIKPQDIVDTSTLESFNAKINLIIDFNELENFKLNAKESLLNDIMYVFLKNSCEHTLRYFIEINNQEIRHANIFIDLYISDNDKYKMLNIEFTNQTDTVCQHIFKEINESTKRINNKSNKNNSTGIGVTNLRDRLNKIYSGKEKSSISFKMINANTIKSKISLPITVIKHQDEKIFKNKNECLNQSNILYIEDDTEIAKENIKLLKEKNIHVNHTACLDNNVKKVYNLLITDINIPKESTSNANPTNGRNAINNYMENNPNGIILILSSDWGNIKDKVPFVDNGYTVELPTSDNIEKFQTKHIYILEEKSLNGKENLIQAIKNCFDKNLDIVQSSSQANNDNIQKNKKLFTTPINDLDTLKNLVSPDDITYQLYKSKEKDFKSILTKWNTIVIQTDDSKESISNSDIQEEFSTRLIIKIDNLDTLKTIFHEGLTKNILFVYDKLSDDKIIEIANESLKSPIPEKGIFGIINHDLRAIKDDSGKDIMDLNSKCRSLSEQYFKSFKEQTTMEKEDETFGCKVERLKNLIKNRKEDTKEIVDTLEFLLTIIGDKKDVF